MPRSSRTLVLLERVPNRWVCSSLLLLGLTTGAGCLTEPESGHIGVGCSTHGVCGGEGVVLRASRINGEWVCEYDHVVHFEALQEQSCDGLDNDCDGLVDEELTPALAKEQRGVCAGMTQVCQGTEGWQEPEPTTQPGYEPEEVSCDGLDNDCNGLTDEELPPPVLPIGQGVCAPVAPVCRAGQWVLEQAATLEDYEPNETRCDGLDNDCDGLTDEELTPPLVAGVCRNLAPQCQGAAGWLPASAATLPDYEAEEHRCDGRDNDCDGLTDEPRAGWSRAAMLPEMRSAHAAVRLLDGRVLIVGGWTSGADRPFAPDVTLLYDPVTDRWEAPPGSILGSCGPGGALGVLDDGRVVLVHASGPDLTQPTPVADRLELGRPWERIQNPTCSHGPWPVVVLLPDGRLLALGGALEEGDNRRGCVDWLKPDGAWERRAPLPAARDGLAATLLGDGQVLVVGGWDPGQQQPTARRDGWLYQPRGDFWSEIEHMQVARFAPALFRLRDGRVLAVGGVGPEGRALGSAELYDPETGRWTLVPGEMTRPRFDGSITLLADERVLITGGRSVRAGAPQYPRGEPLPAELLEPTSWRWTTVPALAVARGGHSATLLEDGRILVVGGQAADGGWISEVERFDPGCPVPLLQPSTIDFGALPSGVETPPARVILHNASRAVLEGLMPELTEMGPNPAFFMAAPAPGSCQPGGRLDPGASCTVELQFQPPERFRYHGELQLRANGFEPLVARLTGVGYAVAQGEPVAGFPQSVGSPELESQGFAARVGPDDELWIAGTARVEDSRGCAIWALGPDGRLREGFPFLQGGAVGSGEDHCDGLAVDPQGGVWAAGRAAASTDQVRALAWRVEANGRPRPGWPWVDQFEVQAYTGSNAFGVAMADQGRVWVAGHRLGSQPPTQPQLALWLLGSDGQLVPGFPVIPSRDSPQVVEHGKAMAVDVAGRVWIVGHLPTGRLNVAQLWRFTPMGELEPGFPKLAVTDADRQDSVALALGLAPDGRGWTTGRQVDAAFVQLLDRDGSLGWTTLLPAMQEVRSLDFDAIGNGWVIGISAENRGFLAGITPLGIHQVPPRAIGADDPHAIAVAPNGELWVVGQQAEQLQVWRYQ